MYDILAEIKEIEKELDILKSFDIPQYQLGGQWFTPNQTWVYVSGTSFKIVGRDVTNYFAFGTKLWATNSGTKYWYSLGATFAAGDTTVTIVGDAVANTTISSPRISWAETPYDFPQWFAWTPTYVNFTLGDGTATCRFNITGGRTIHALGQILLGSTSAVAGSLFISYPVANVHTGFASTLSIGQSLCFDSSAGAHYEGGVGSSTIYLRIRPLATAGAYATQVDCGPNVPFTWETSDSIGFNILYRG